MVSRSTLQFSVAVIMRRGRGSFSEDSSPLVNIFSLATVVYVTLLVSTAESAGNNNANTCLVTAHARAPAETMSMIIQIV